MKEPEISFNKFESIVKKNVNPFAKKLGWTKGERIGNSEWLGFKKGNNECSVDLGDLVVHGKVGLSLKYVNLSLNYRNARFTPTTSKHLAKFTIICIKKLNK